MTMSGRLPFTARLWGARGTLASLGDRSMRYGGNTACVEVTCGDRRIIIDAGSGLRGLGDAMMANHASTLEAASGAAPDPVHLFFSHCHYDHISGLPFFGPFFDPGFTINLWSGHLPGPDKTRRMVDAYMKPPFFPVGPEVFAAELAYRDFEPGDVLRPFDGVVLRTMALDHHDGCIGYRVEFDGRSLCYMTDTTHQMGKHDADIIEMCRGTDMMIYDATYTDEEFPQFWNFGHSTWQEGVRLARLAGARGVCFFHHRPSRTDEALDEIGHRAIDLWPRVDTAGAPPPDNRPIIGPVVGREGMVMEL